LILVDSSVWIDFFSSSPGKAGIELKRLISTGEPVAVAGVIVAEVLQGLKRDPDRIETFLSEFNLLEPAGFETYRAAASIFRKARVKGVSPSTIDTIIAAIALEHSTPILTLDLDFTRLVRVTPIDVYYINPNSVH